MKVREAVAERGGGDRRIAFPSLVLLAVLLLTTVLALQRPTDAAVKKDEFPVSTVSNNQLAPDISGNIVVWEDKRNNLSSIYGKNLSTNTEFLVASGVSVKSKPVTNGQVVAWEDDRNGNSDIYGYRIPADLSTPGQEFLIASGPGDQRKPAISGGTVVWEDNRSGKWEIYKYDLSIDTEALVATGEGNKTNPTIDGDTVVWQDDRNTVGNSDIYAKNLSTGQEFPVSTGTAFADTPAISGSIVVWRQESVGNYDIFGKDLYAKDLETGEVFQITTDAKDQVAPAISGNVVVWEDHRDGSSNIYGKDLSTGQEFQLTTGATPQETPEINGETVVWESQRIGETNYGTYDVYGANLDAAPNVPAGAKAAATPSGGIEINWTANTETDLTGYNVYRSDSPNGTYVKLNGTLLSGTTYSDSNTPRGSVFYYQIKAADAISESGAANVSAVVAAPSTVTLSASPATLDLGGTTTLSGKLTVQADAGVRPASGKQVFLEGRSAGQTNFTEIKSASTSTDGAFSFGGIKPTGDTEYRARFAGDSAAGMNSTTSAGVNVVVILKTGLTLNASPATLNYGQGTTLSGKLSASGTPLAGKQVVLEQRPAGAISFIPVLNGQRTTGSDGSFTLSGVKPLKNTQYRARFAGDAGLPASTSGLTLVNVKARVSVSAPPKIKPGPAPRVSISGQVVTARAGNVQVTILRDGKVIVNRSVSLNSSRFGLAQKLPGKGRYVVKASYPKSATHLGNTSIRRFAF